MRMGLYPDAPPRPFVPGYEVSGKVHAVGSNVSEDEFRKGDLVYAGTFFGGHSSFVLVNKDSLFKVPSGVSMSQAAALPVNFITAYASLMEMGRMR